jgi:hypothetical protein
MFELRLGLALGKSVAEIRALSIVEYRRWKLFYQIEPWGFHQDEYRMAAILAMLYNTTQRSPKTPNDFMRRLKDLDSTQDHFESLSVSEQKIYVIEQVRKSFAGAIIEVKQ